LSTVAFSKLY